MHAFWAAAACLMQATVAGLNVGAGGRVVVVVEGRPKVVVVVVEPDGEVVVVGRIVVVVVVEGRGWVVVVVVVGRPGMVVVVVLMVPSARFGHFVRHAAKVPRHFSRAGLQPSLQVL